ncbi:MAG: hypothetical protein P4M00_06565 [Azospirillaceae bacterium]|nr:hypothetical protein [Azospirillaceae bacterium]
MNDQRYARSAGRAGRGAARALMPYAGWGLLTILYYFVIEGFLTTLIGFSPDRSASIAHGMAVAVGSLGVVVMVILGVGWRRRR